ncbi:hypothetical protein [Oscillatoria sp. FACHB-1407]|nr:hypothetical protein [Oscillatoria sp. FACHB-1407]
MDLFAERVAEESYSHRHIRWGGGESTNPAVAMYYLYLKDE